MPARRWGGSGACERGTQRRDVPLCPPSPAVARPQEPLDASTRVRTRRGRHDHHRRHVRRRPLEDGVVEEARDGRLLLQAAGHPRRLRHGARRLSASSTGSAANRQAAVRRHVEQAAGTAEKVTYIDPPKRTRSSEECRSVLWNTSYCRHLLRLFQDRTPLYFFSLFKELMHMSVCAAYPSDGTPSLS